MRTYLVAAVFLLLCCVSVGAEPVVVHGNGRIAAAVTLRNTLPSSVMWGLGLLSIEDKESGKADMWRAGVCSASPRITAPSVALTGIDLVVPCDDKQALVVYGEKAAVEEFKATVAMWDVVPRQVQVKADFIALGIDEAKELGIENITLASMNPARLAEVKQSLTEHGAEFIFSPIISGINSVPATVAVKDQSQSLQLVEISRINADGTITITVRPSLDEPSIPRKQELHTQRRIADGESIMLGGFHYGEPAKSLWLIVTANIVERATASR